MSTASTFTRQLTISDIPMPAKSVGAHLAAKLQHFQTDERTLTDELCDMLCIWLGMPSLHFVQFSPQPSPSFTLTLSKTTTSEEVKNGADLELFVSSPLGVKRCLIQAKVLDPVSGRLRCNSSTGWRKLRTQLVAARREVGDLAFLLVYVPGANLDGNNYGCMTYEQQNHFKATGTEPAYFGATLIPVNSLLDASDCWLDPKLKVPQLTAGKFKNGFAFWYVLVELLLCRRSTWTTDPGPKHEERMKTFRRFSIGVSDISAEVWLQIQETADQYLDIS